MQQENWHQQKSLPLYEDVLWLRPENPRQRPKVLVIGGSSHGLSSVIKLYDQIKSKSAYQTKVAMPKTVEGLIGSTVDDAVYVEATSSGEISSESEDQMIQFIEWAEVVVVSDDIGNNSQTEILLSKLLKEIDKPIFFIGSSHHLVSQLASEYVSKTNVVFVLDVAELSKFNLNTPSTIAIRQADGLIKLIDSIQNLTLDWKCTILTIYENKLVASQASHVTTTEVPTENWMINITARSIEFAKLFPTRRLEAITTGAHLVSKEH